MTSSLVAGAKCQMPRLLNWRGCYDDSWKGVITDESFAHPAKYARGLIECIIGHGLIQGWWRDGDLIGDPFGGIGTGGITCSTAGLRWIGVELEPRFVAMAEANFDLNERPMFPDAHPRPQIVQGDSRRFADIVGRCTAESAENAEKTGGAGGIVTSPPYVSGGHHPDQTGSWGGQLYQSDHRGLGSKEAANYGQTPGQIGRLKEGELGAVVTSPPYADSIERPSGIDPEKFKQQRYGDNTQALQSGYGSEPGNIGNLREGQISGMVTSPPFGEDQPCQSQTKAIKDYHAFTRGNGTKRDQQMQSEGNLSQSDPDTYWRAMDDVYRQCWLALRPGGHMAIVVKDYVKKGQRVPLCDQTLQLLEHVGFEPVQRIRAHLTQTVFENGRERTIERKSFFRRLAEKNGSPRIDWEEVLVVRKQEDALVQKGGHS